MKGSWQLVSLGEEIRAATRIQNSILPRTSPEMESFNLAVRYAPLRAVAGDFYDFLVFRPGCLGIVVADVTGHGVPAALVASMVSGGLRKGVPIPSSKWSLYREEDAFRQLSSLPLISFEATCREQQEEGTRGNSENTP